MIDLRSSLMLPHGLASFNNKEIYYIISNLFELGGFGDGFIEKERLYLNFDNEFHVKFLFISTLPIISDTENQETPSTQFFFGDFDETFEEIEIYGCSVSFEDYRADGDYLNLPIDMSEHLSNSDRIFLKPVTLVKGLVGIIDTHNVKTRRPNNSFYLNSGQNVPSAWFITVDTLVSRSNKDFSGRYYLITEPLSSLEAEPDIRGSLLYEHNITSDNEYLRSSHPMDDISIKNFPN